MMDRFTMAMFLLTNLLVSALTMRGSGPGQVALGLGDDGYTGQLIVTGDREPAACCCTAPNVFGNDYDCKWWPTDAGARALITGLGLGTTASTGCKARNFISASYNRFNQQCCDALTVPRSKNYAVASFEDGRAAKPSETPRGRREGLFWWRLPEASAMSEETRKDRGKASSIFAHVKPGAVAFKKNTFEKVEFCAKPYGAADDGGLERDSTVDAACGAVQGKWTRTHRDRAAKMCVKSPGENECATLDSPSVGLWDDANLKAKLENLALQPLSRLYIMSHGHYAVESGSGADTSIVVGRAASNKIGHAGGGYSGEDTARLLAPGLLTRQANSMRISVVACSSGRAFCPAFVAKLRKLLYQGSRDEATKSRLRLTVKCRLRSLIVVQKDDALGSNEVTKKLSKRESGGFSIAEQMRATLPLVNKYKQKLVVSNAWLAVYQMAPNHEAMETAHARVPAHERTPVDNFHRAVIAKLKAEHPAEYTGVMLRAEQELLYFSPEEARNRKLFKCWEVATGAVVPCEAPRSSKGKDQGDDDDIVLCNRKTYPL